MKESIEDQLEATLLDLTEERMALDREIAKRKAALDVLRGNVPPPRRSSPTARRSLLEALATFDTPVHTTRLLDHELLVHYSRHTLRGALADLHRAHEIEGERAPKGYIWDPRSAGNGSLSDSRNSG
jgi:hypothetical protein